MERVSDSRYRQPTIRNQQQSPTATPNHQPAPSTTDNRLQEKIQLLLTAKLWSQNPYTRQPTFTNRQLLKSPTKLSFTGKIKSKCFVLQRSQTFVPMTSKNSASTQRGRSIINFFFDMSNSLYAQLCPISVIFTDKLTRWSTCILPLMMVTHSILLYNILFDWQTMISINERHQVRPTHLPLITAFKIFIPLLQVNNEIIQEQGFSDKDCLVIRGYKLICINWFTSICKSRVS